MDYCAVARRKEKISRFLFLKEAVEGAAIGGDYTTALNLLEIIFDTYGATMWSVQLRIALEQVVGGLEQQKSMLRKCDRSISRDYLHM